MSGVNRVTLVGHLGADPEVKSLEGGKQVATFSVATSETWTKDNQKHESTEWHRVVAWNKLAEICGKYLKKGGQVYIEGKLQTRSYEKDGVKRYTTEIVANSLQMLGKKDGARRDEGDPGPQPDNSEEAL